MLPGSDWSVRGEAPEGNHTRTTEVRRRPAWVWVFGAVSLDKRLAGFPQAVLPKSKVPKQGIYLGFGGSPVVADHGRNSRGSGGIERERTVWSSVCNVRPRFPKAARCGVHAEQRRTGQSSGPVFNHYDAPILQREDPVGAIKNAVVMSDEQGRRSPCCAHSLEKINHLGSTVLVQRRCGFVR
jgi:hypothetical protein